MRLELEPVFHTAYYSAHYSIEKPSLDIQVKAGLETR